ncbi:PilN domain-containing protein [Kineococcus sp. SYSU DK005]|uniref:PilN domain-containing protein n=1 Tax=Kineococcus sp. SYSU DK005 TaxID=3383126 RepID=UPI003D7E8E17
MSFQTLEAVAARTRVVRVDLLPREFEEARRGRLLKAGLGLALAGVLGFAGVAHSVSAGHVDDAAQELAAEQARTAQLHAEQQPYADVPRVLAEVEAVEAVRTQVKAGAVPWYAYLDQLASGAPADLSMTSVEFATNAAAQDASGAVSAAGEPGVGVLTVTGETRTPEKVADWMDQVASIEGLSEPTLSDATRAEDTGVVTFNATATVNGDALAAQR